MKLHDAYLSVAEALRHGGYENGVMVTIQWVEAEEVTQETAPSPAGSGRWHPGSRRFWRPGVEGKNRGGPVCQNPGVPYLGICLGMQTAVIEFARSVLGLTDANSGEFDEKSEHKVIDLMPDQRGNLPKGGTMRLGAYPCQIAAGSLMEKSLWMQTDFRAAPAPV